jgi:hypothetical protein
MREYVALEIAENKVFSETEQRGRRKTEGPGSVFV